MPASIDNKGIMNRADMKYYGLVFLQPNSRYAGKPLPEINLIPENHLPWTIMSFDLIISKALCYCYYIKMSDATLNL